MKDNNRKINAERDIQNELGRNAIKIGINMDFIKSMNTVKS